MSIYRFRAEVRSDADNLYRNIADKVEYVTMTIKPPFPDVEVEIETDMSLNDLRDEMRAVPDGHVMLQTVATKNKYTGERDFSLK